MNEIRFRQSEDELVEAIKKRRACGIGLLHTPCSICGSYKFVTPIASKMINECEDCFADRWIKERFKE